MPESRLASPELVELLSSDEVASLLDATHSELAALEQRAERARAAADELELRARTEGADERSSTWAIVRMQRFVDGLREDAEHDAATVVDAARRRARAQVDRLVDHPVTRAEAVMGTRVGPLQDGPAAPAPANPAAMPVTPIGAVSPLVVAPSAAPAEVPPSLQWSLVDDHAPAPNGVHATNGGTSTHTVPTPNGVPTPSAVPTANAPSAPAPPTVVVADTIAAVAPPPAPPVADPVVPVAPVPADPVAPAVDHPEKHRRGLLRGFPLSAVLEVIAVLLVLLFILLRLS